MKGSMKALKKEKLYVKGFEEARHKIANVSNHVCIQPRLHPRLGYVPLNEYQLQYKYVALTQVALSRGEAPLSIRSPRCIMQRGLQVSEQVQCVKRRYHDTL
jgi:hypothetical protein